MKHDPVDPTLASIPRSTPSMSDIIKFVTGLTDLTETRRRDLLSDCRSFVRLVNLPADQIKADPPYLRKLVAGISPTASRISKKRFANLLSNVRTALRLFGIDLAGKRRQGGRIPEWELLWAAVREQDNHALRNGLSGGVHFASNHGVFPDQIDDGFVAFYARALDTSEIRAAPKTIVRTFVRMWNRARLEVPGWPQRELTVPNNRDVISEPWDVFPETLCAETHAFLHRDPSDDIFDLSAPDKALAPATVIHRENQIRRAASILARLGDDPASIGSLSALIANKNPERVLRWMLDRNGGKISGAIGGMAQMLSTLALYLENDAAYRECRTFARRLTPPRHGMGEKNTKRLRPFGDRKEVLRLLNLPEVFVRRAGKLADGSTAALLVESALLINFLTYSPIRARNLVGIRLDEHLVRIKGQRDRVHLVIPFEQTKNREPLEFPLQPATVALLDRFVVHHRPHLLTHDGQHLFSQRGKDGPLGRSTLRNQVTKRIFDETGHTVHPHLFRHLSAKIFLSVNPGQYETIRRLLGHRGLSSALEQYTGIETDAANEAYAKLLDSLRKGRRS